MNSLVYHENMHAPPKHENCRCQTLSPQRPSLRDPILLQASIEMMKTEEERYSLMLGKEHSCTGTATPRRHSWSACHVDTGQSIK